MKNFLQEMAAVCPSTRQLDWFKRERYVFLHFGVNTFTNREWGTGQEPESMFNPQKLDCNQWAEAVKEAGFTAMVLTAKHHDGFCLWPSKYTAHSVKNSPIKRDVVGEAADACKKAGIGFGFYLSPWDMNSPYYGTPAYNDYFCNQLTELLTEYGPIFYVWFDGACGEGPAGKKQEYDYERYFALIRKYQPNAVIFNDHGPDVRWCGNESGSARHGEWAVVPGELCHFAQKQTGAGPFAQQGDLSFLYNTDLELGSLSGNLFSRGLCFCPSEIDMSIRKGWFWHQEEEPHSLERLFAAYLGSVGGNASLHLNVPPNTDGLLDERDVKRLKELGDLIQQQLGTLLQASCQKQESPPMQPLYAITLPAGASPKYVVLGEDLTKGQRIESFTITAAFHGGEKYPLYQGTTVGNKRICQLEDPFKEQNPFINLGYGTPSTLFLKVKAARGTVYLKTIAVY